MHGPFFSTLTLFTELIVSSVVYSTLYSGYRNNKFLTIPAFAALIYETIFNISYMASRVPTHVSSAEATPGYLIALAAVHGILSLVMFVALIIFFITAWRNYKKGINYFKDHKRLTILFLIFWTFSIASGITFYFLEYGG